MIYFDLRDENGEMLFSNIEQCIDANLFIGSEQESKTINKIKNMYKTYRDGSVRLIIVEEEDLINSSKLSNKALNTYAVLIGFLKKAQKDQAINYTIFSHNLITTHTKLQGEIESIIPPTELISAGQHNDQLKLVQSKIKKNFEGTAESLLQIMKRIVDLEAQIEGFKILSGKVDSDMDEHNIKRVLLNIAYPFYDDFKKNNITLKILIDDDVAEQNKINLNYKLFNVAMHHFFNNIVKYAKPYSRVDVAFDAQHMTLEFNMMSVRIDKEERENIFKLSYSGTNSGNLAGDGVGMFMVKKSLDLLNARMGIAPNYQKSEEINGVKYVENKFIVYFNLQTIGVLA